MMPMIVLWSALALGLLTSISPCPLATNVAAIGYIGRSIGDPRRVLVSGLLYTAGRMIVYVALGVLILSLLGSAAAGGEPGGAAPAVSRFLQRYMGMILGPVLIVVGMILLGLIQVSFSTGVGGERLKARMASGGALWALPLGMLFALSFCPVSASLFFIGLVGLSTQHASPILLPTLYGIGTAVPVIGFAVLIAFAGRYVGMAFNNLTRIERWARTGTGVIFLAAGFYYTLTHIYGLRLFV